jgi:hypothetical protein
MFTSPQIIIFMEYVYNWLRIDSKELKKYEKFPVGGLRHTKYTIQKKKCVVSQHKPRGLDLCEIHSTQQLRTIMFHEQICLIHHIYGFPTIFSPKVIIFNTCTIYFMVTKYVGGVL